MERVLIVAKTQMGSVACIGGLSLDTNKSVRLLRSDGSNQPMNTLFDVGQVWELDFHRSSQITPPHVEDVFVTKEQYIGQQSNLRTFLIQRVQPWEGGPEKLFNGLLSIDHTKGFISRRSGIPNCSTGYWLPDTELILTYRDNKPYYEIDYLIRISNDSSRRTLSIKYVGFSDPIPQIRVKCLVRVSLARWWTRSGVNEERCYLQLSGWYL